MGLLSSTAAFHPEFRTAARFLPRRSVTPRTLPVVRRLTRLVEMLVRGDVETHVIGTATARMHRPATPVDHGDAGQPAVLWIHGGGHVMGSPKMDERSLRDLADRLGVLVVAAGYRLSPEHPFPASVDDCNAVLEWLAARDDIDPTRIVIAGASAGGGLTASLALLARGRGVVTPCAQILVYPMLDDRTCTRRDADTMDVRVWDNRANRFGWASYLGTEPGGDDVSDIAAPARHGDLSGLPPTWIGVGTQDLFHDEDIAYAARLEAAGVPCTLEVVEGGFHGFDVLAKTSPTKSFLASRDAAIATALGLA